VAVEQGKDKLLAQGLRAHRLGKKRNKMIQARGNHPRCEYQSHKPDGIFHKAPAQAVVIIFDHLDVIVAE
jgi:hypothetical protein